MRTRYLPALFSVLLFVLAACGGAPAAPPPAGDTAAIAADTSFSSRGDAARGKELFVTCGACHTTTSDKLVGPGLAGLFGPSGPTLPAGVDYAGKLSNGQERTETNIAAWIRSGGTGKIGVMAPQALDDQQMADLMAYLRTFAP